MKLREGHVSNSSSSSFICRTRKTPEQVEKILKTMLNHYNALTTKNLDFADVFKKPYVASKSGIHTMWQDHFADFKTCAGRVVIDSVEDNSIPYVLEEIIEERFDATRYHRG
jgi:hypothetical protein